MKVRGGEFSTGTMGNFQPELTYDLRHTLHPPLKVTGNRLDSPAPPLQSGVSHGWTMTKTTRSSQMALTFLRLVAGKSADALRIES